MPRQNPQRVHHYVPEFYLKRWQLGGDRFLEFSRPIPNRADVKYRWVSPKQTGYLDKLYYLDHLPEHLRNGYEDRFFTPVDTKASRVLDRFEAGCFETDSAQRSSWARFIMSLTFRTPETIQAIRRELERDIFNPSKESERSYRQRRLRDQPRTLRAALEAERNDNDLDHVALQVSTGLADSRKIGQRLINTVWGFRHMPLNAPALLTSDRPLMWAFSMDDPQFHIVLPTGPKTLFWAARTPRMVSMLQNTEGTHLVRFMNEHVTRRAVRYVWGASLRQHQYVQQFMGVDPDHTIPDTLIEQRWAMLKRREQRARG
jgi:Protein of unknown function (DUF4238)